MNNTLFRKQNNKYYDVDFYLNDRVISSDSISNIKFKKIKSIMVEQAEGEKKVWLEFTLIPRLFWFFFGIEHKKMNAQKKGIKVVHLKAQRIC